MNRPPIATTPCHLRNSFRYRNQPQWFDFYNCRVVLPERGLYFFAMPYMLSGAAVPKEIAGMHVYDGGNGGTLAASTVAVETLGVDGWTASQSHCDVHWNKPDAADNLFSETEIRLVGPQSRWDIRIEPFLGDREPAVTDMQQFDLEERIILKRAPFIHRVPRMKAFATGTIVQQGRRHEFERAVVYQAKNHGHGFPDDWNWIHANIFDEDTTLAFEVASLRAPTGAASVARIARPDGVNLLASWLGDEVNAERIDDRYEISGCARDGSVKFAGEARHGENVVFSFPAPDGSRFENDECFVGHLNVDIDGERFTSHFAALGRARRFD